MFELHANAALTADTITVATAPIVAIATLSEIAIDFFLLT
jgi:hypothetical protein